MIKIDSIKVKAIYDENPDTSWIGEYTNEAHDWNICHHCGEYVRNATIYNDICNMLDQDIIELISNELSNHDIMADKNRYRRIEKIHYAMETALKKFTNNLHNCPESSREYNYFKPYARGEDPGTKEYQEYGKQDFKRYEALNRGEYNFIGIQAEAVVSYENSNGYRLETLTSGGLWGIESDATDYHKEIVQEELDSLKKHLERFNVNMCNWKELTSDIELFWYY